MSNEFQRENRFLVLKWEDIEKYLGPEHRRSIQYACAAVEERRRMDGKRKNAYVVVADDWPEYEMVWKAIEDRVSAGSDPSP